MLSSETATEPDSEETDLLARSTKKIKVDMGKATNGRNGSLWMNTYRRMRSNKLSAEEKRRLREPWKQTLIIKIMGRTLKIRNMFIWEDLYTFLMKRLRMMWRIQRHFSLVDLGNEFFWKNSHGLKVGNMFIWSFYS
ncbi:hypothetical protein POTOM_009461 [Populus tomentosa]|uniref:Uncharacterized protein n=1 Tax=Populus tomentosa TaxID=118781 RepID=A0A8X8DA77_POPTO|nr:hypothetical protein POTOM_009461 [Populus tomentosa]